MYRHIYVPKYNISLVYYALTVVLYYTVKMQLYTVFDYLQFDCVQNKTIFYNLLLYIHIRAMTRWKQCRVQLRRK